MRGNDEDGDVVMLDVATDVDESAATRVRVRNVDHVAVAVVDLEEAIAWYTRALGFRCVEKRHTRGERTAMLSAVLVQGDAVIVLVQGTSPTSQVSRFIEHYGPGVQHVAFGVDDLSKVLDQVRKAGGDQEIEPIDGEGIKQVFLRRDPGSGVRVELIERKGGNFSDETVERLFRSFEKADLY